MILTAWLKDVSVTCRNSLSSWKGSGPLNGLLFALKIICKRNSLLIFLCESFRVEFFLRGGC